MFDRHARLHIDEALTDTPVVLIHGARQVGKSTLADVISESANRTRVTLDDPIALGLALQDPMAFLAAYPEPITIDEVQRAPELFLPIKLTVDRKRTPGSFLMTGSANVLMLPKLADSLAGRIQIVDLLPLSQGEIEGQPDGFVDALFSDGGWHPTWEAESDADLLDRVVRGGFPEAVQRSDRRRPDWFDNYIRTILERDVKDLANLEALVQMPRVLNLLAARVGGQFNVSSLSTDTGIAYTTLRRYLGLLETLFLTKLVQPWSRNLGTRLTKTPKLYLVDTGLLCHLLHLSHSALQRDRERLGPVLENFVAMELAKQCANGTVHPSLLHLRTVRQLEVDFVLENRAGEVVGIEVKCARTVTRSMASGLRYFRDIAEGSFRRGIVLYCGDERVVLDDRIEALPINSLWRTAPAP